MTFEAVPLVAIVGPTGSGKSDLALRVAREFSGEVVNCDSLQVYRFFDIGTAKLSPAGREGVTHHLIDVLDPEEVFTAGEYASRARAAIAEIAARGHLPVVAGGTGFYLRALLEGLFPGPKRNVRLRARLARREARHPGWLHAFLARHDPASAARIHASDVQKLIRACEILLIERRPLTELFDKGRDRLEGYRVLKLGIDPPRDALYARINARCEHMFAAGLVEEVKGLLEAGHSPAAKPFGSVGYKEALALVRGEIGLAEAIELAQRSTRRYSKRQWTWFRRDPEIVWLKGFGAEPAVDRAAFDLVNSFLKNVQSIT